MSLASTTIRTDSLAAAAAAEATTEERTRSLGEEEGTGTEKVRKNKKGGGRAGLVLIATNGIALSDACCCSRAS